MLCLHQPLSYSGSLDEKPVFLSGLLRTSPWDRRSGTRGLGGPGGFRSPGSLKEEQQLTSLLVKTAAKILRQSPFHD